LLPRKHKRLDVGQKNDSYVGTYVPRFDKSIAKNAWTLVMHASANEGTLGRDPLMQRERHLIKGNNAL